MVWLTRLWIGGFRSFLDLVNAWKIACSTVTSHFFRIIRIGVKLYWCIMALTFSIRQSTVRHVSRSSINDAIDIPITGDSATNDSRTAEIEYAFALDDIILFHESVSAQLFKFLVARMKCMYIWTIKLVFLYWTLVDVSGGGGAHFTSSMSRSRTTGN